MSLGLESTMDIIPFSIPAGAQDYLGRKKPSSPTWVTGHGLVAALGMYTAFWTGKTISELFWFVSGDSSYKLRKVCPEQWYTAFVSPHFPSAVTSAIRVPASNSLLTCNLLFLICHLRNQMTRAARTMCKLRAKLWEITEDPLQNSLQRVSWQPFPFFSELFLSNFLLHRLKKLISIWRRCYYYEMQWRTHQSGRRRHLT